MGDKDKGLSDFSISHASRFKRDSEKSSLFKETILPEIIEKSKRQTSDSEKDKADSKENIAKGKGKSKGKVKSKGKSKKPHYYGHRDRLRNRFIDGGADSLPDYEMLELLLFQTIPRRDVKPIAKDLLAEFGSFSDVLTANIEILQKRGKISRNAAIGLKTVQAAATRLARQEMKHLPILSNWQSLIDYCFTAMSHLEVEQFRVLYLDTKNRVLCDEAQGEGTVNHTPAYPREIIKRALEVGATALILVHNHPSGDPAPSNADIEMTARIMEAAAAMGLAVHDHLIIGKGDYASFKSLGLM